MKNSIPGSVLEVPEPSQLVLMKALLETEAISTMNCTDEESKVETWGKLPKLMQPESCWN